MTRRDERQDSRPRIQIGLIDRTGLQSLAGQSALLAFGVGYVLDRMHAGAEEATAISPTLHWLRDATLALPLAFIAVWLGLALAGRFLRWFRLAADAQERNPLSRVASATFVAFIYAAVTVPGSVAHAWLFGASREGASFQTHATREASAVLGVGLVVLLGLAIGDALASAMIRRRSYRQFAMTSTTRLAAVGGAITMLAAMFPTNQSFVPLAASAEPVRCSASSPDRSYDVVAISLTIPYNRWGDNDPNGQTYVLRDDKSAVKNWSLPLNADENADPANNRRLRPRPLVLRANVGECVKVTFTNELNAVSSEGLPTNPRASMHVHGASYDAQTSDGGMVGYNPDTTVAIGQSITYLWKAPEKEGVYSFHDDASPAGSEADGGSVAHGLFGSLAVEPAGSTWTDPVSGLDSYRLDANGVYTRTNVESGDPYVDADIHPPSAPSFRESVQVSQDEIPGGIGFGFNFGAEPIRNRVANRCPDCVSEETSLSSWVYGDPALIKLASGPGPWLPTPGNTDVEDCGLPGSCYVANVTRAYVGDPTKIRFGNTGPKETHVFHMHAHQWRAEQEDADSTTLDSQTFGPQEMFTADLIAGAGSTPGTFGDSIFHCHLYPHFADGFWALFRVHDVREDGSGTTPDGVRMRNLMPLPDRAPLPLPTPDNPGYPRFIPGQVGWRAPQPPGAITEPDPTTPDPNDRRVADRIVAGQLLDPAKVAVEQSVQSLNYGGATPKPGAPFRDPCPSGARQVTFNVSVMQAPIVYNEDGWRDTQGRILVLEEDVGDVLAGKNPEPLFFRVNAGDCINFNLTNLLPNWLGNDAFQQLVQTNMVGQHIHLVKFDVLGSDGSSNGWNYQEAAFTKEQMEFNADVLAGNKTCDRTNGCRLPTPASWDPQYKGVDVGQTISERWFADYELRTVFTHDHHFPALDQNRGLFGGLIVEPANTDFRNPRTGEYYQPINDPSHGTPCGSSCVGNARGYAMDIIGPGQRDDFREYALAMQDFVPLTRAGGDPQNPLDTLNPPRAPEEMPKEDPGVMGINYRNAPFLLRQKRNGVPVDPAYVFSSSVWGDPQTPMLYAYARDPVRVRLLVGSQEEQHVFTMNGVRWRDMPDDPGSQFVNSRSAGTSDAFNFEAPELTCGANDDCRGDYLYQSATIDDTYLGMWGLMRVYGRGVSGLLALPDNVVAGSSSGPSPPGGQTSGSPPPIATSPGNPCPAGAPSKQFSVVALEANIVYNSAGDNDPYGLMYALVLPGETPEQAVARARANPQPLVMRANEGDCLEVRLTNKLTSAFLNHNGTADGDARAPLEPSGGTKAGLRVSLHPQLLKYDVRGSDGATVGYNRDQTVGPGETILYRWYADDVNPGELGAINLSDFGDVRGHRHHGLFAGLNIEPKDARYYDPLTGAEIASGAQADIRVPGMADFREFTVFFQDGLNLRTRNGAIIEDPAPPLPTPEDPSPAPMDPEDEGEKGFNYRNEPFVNRLGMEPVDGVPDGQALAQVFSSQVYGDPATPIFRAYAGDPIRMRVLSGADKPRQHTFQQGGHAWQTDPGDANSPLIGAQGGITASTARNMQLMSAGGAGAYPGDYRYNCGLFFHHLSGGLWGITRVYSPPTVLDGFVPSSLATVDNPYLPDYRPIMPLEPVLDTTPPGPPVANPAGGSFTAAQSVTLTAEAGATIRYTTDGSNPTVTTGTVYTTPIQVAASMTVKAVAIDSSGNPSTVMTAVYTIDANLGAPVVAAPTQVVKTGSITATGQAPVTISWSATDPDGVARYQLQQSTGGGAWTNVKITATAKSKVLNLAPGQNYQFQVKATDRLGNASTFATGPVFWVDAFQETDPALLLTGSWTQATLGGAFGGSVKSASSAGSSAKLTFTGTSVGFVATRASSYGKAEVWLDGARVATLNLYSSATTAGKIVWARGGLASGNHVLEIRVLGTKVTTSTGTRVDFDAIVVTR